MRHACLYVTPFSPFHASTHKVITCSPPPRQVDVFPRVVTQGACALITVKLPPPSFLLQRLARSLCSLLAPGRLPFQASFQGHALVPFPSLTTDTLFHALVPVTANDDVSQWYQVHVATRTWLGMDDHAYLLPLKVAARPSRPPQDLWLDPGSISTSPSDLTNHERTALSQAIHQGAMARPCPATPALRTMSLPCPAADIGTYYGIRRRYNLVEVPGYFHEGIDLEAAHGTRVLAPDSGQVVLVATERGGFTVHGNTVVVDHGRGLASVCAHLGDVTVATGDRVAKGACVGVVGSTGLSTGPHLHWGVYASGRPVDPEMFLQLE